MRVECMLVMLREGHADLAFYGTVTATVADGILRLTKVGRNRVEIAGRKYYYVRSFTHFEDRGAVVFAPSWTSEKQTGCIPGCS
ncbi:hypothetical protein BN2476_360033 [Paraburkholderia piptadeniae]|uniref:Uncharacterized protein n=1 Tax=Paraburkholderia piptadeniae TaxID=1701573 RepID=A0A1N7S952_9BURK|nr:hypothetical protein BN2476_360033 [Paraburkholderia piptadeniae]